MSLPFDNPGYVGADYLARVAQATAPVKSLSYERMRVSEGMRVLDVGCGPATDTLALAERVGPTGSVVGVDHDAAMVADAERRAASAGLAGRVSHRAGDAQALPFDEAVFDAARCERLFLHLADPGAAMRELARVVRPGGRVVAVDTDFGTLSIDCSDPQLERRLARAMARDALLNGFSGRRLFGQMRRAGLSEVHAEAVPFVVTSYPFARDTLRFGLMEGAALRTGAVTEREVAGWREELAAADSFYCSVSVVVATGTRLGR